MRFEEPTFTTELLNVYCMDIGPEHRKDGRKVFIALSRFDDWFVAVSATTNPWPFPIHEEIEFLQMIQQNDDHATDEMARQLWVGIEAHLGRRVFCSPFSVLEETLCDQLQRNFERDYGPAGTAVAPQQQS
jgi:hypothetical protein